ncbi:unnamed protein product (macronuclear) [Paramecium tetraurelia]|uniref:Transmembrane protein n=1 Tax=Paramecium tetraurelia TaxID=5888 RepID=A0CCG1_PARTE|nr:uncharacterized protein GSPATT00037263001 [Paramecium tetraurelia]CAK68478.1 unnamed protein product [Paramecium tetraurelia]|eukprot:XP_001435875.1 hypothetical protein (macronuclear) [Paramecium tetraurelia strain d4-2]
MLIFLLLTIVQSQEYNISADSEKIIDRFEQYGEIFFQEMEYMDKSFQPCHFTKQQLVQSSGLNIDIVESFNETFFVQHYEEGHLSGQIDEIIAAVTIKNGSIVLTRQGKLQHLLITNTITLGSSIQINITTTKKVHLQYFSKNRVLVIIADQETLAFQLSNNTDVFEDSQKLKLYDKFNVDQISSVTTVNDIMFIAMGKLGISIYQFKEKNFQSIPWVVNGQTSSQLQNVVDIKVFSQSQDQIYTIYVLDKNVGVQQYIYNSVTTLISQNTKLGTIPLAGDIFDVKQSVLIIIRHQPTFSSVNELELDLTNNTYRQINKYNTFKDVQDVDILNKYVIILGQNGHQVQRHSLPQKFSNQSSNSIIIPNLQQLDYIDYKNKTIIFGFTKHRFFYSSIREAPSLIVCQANYTEMLSTTFVYKQKSTKCPDNLNITKGEYCQIQKTYTINFIPPTRGGGYYYIILIYVVAFILGLGFMMLICQVCREFKKYENFVKYNEMVENDSIEMEGHNLSPSQDSKKQMKFEKIENKGSSMTPVVYEERDD